MSHADGRSAPAAIKSRDRDTVLTALRAGVVPRTGHQHFQVGRIGEVTALVADIGRIANGGAVARFVIGDYGSGKTFFLSLVRAIALQRKLVTVHADLAPARRLHATGGQARSLYTELMANMATRAKPEGALSGVVERFITTAVEQARSGDTSTEAVIRSRLDVLSDLTGGYDFAAVIAAYWRGYDEGNDQLQADAVRWLRGEYATRTDARAALGVRTIIDDATVYDHLKLMARFVTMAGYGGLLVGLDEMVNLYKLANSQARNANYEQILRMVNDCLQGSAAHIGFLFGGTPEFLLDTKRGLHSYPALASRLAQNSFAVEGAVDYTGPVLRLDNLTAEDFYVLLKNLRTIHESAADATRLPDDALTAFMSHCANRVGDAYFRTPRTAITEFLNMLAILDQNPRLNWSDCVGAVDIAPESNPDLAPLDDEASTGANDDLRTFTL